MGAAPPPPAPPLYKTRYPGYTSRMASPEPIREGLSVRRVIECAFGLIMVGLMVLGRADFGVNVGTLIWLGAAALVFFSAWRRRSLALEDGRIVYRDVFRTRSAAASDVSHQLIFWNVLTFSAGALENGFPPTPWFRRTPLVSLSVPIVGFDRLAVEGFVSALGLQASRPPTRAAVFRRFAPAILVLAAGPLVWFAAVAHFSLPGDVRRALRDADRLELLSLSPDRLSKEEAAAAPSGGLFRGWTVLGKASLEGSERGRLRRALWWGAASGLAPAMCFNPRHGIHAEKNGKTTVDVVICFECGQSRTFLGAEQADGSYALIGGLFTGDFDRLLREHGIPLAGH